MRNVPKNRVENILKLVKQNSKITVDEIANKLNVSSKTIKRDIAKLKEQNRLQRVGKKGGYWVVL